VSGVIQVTINHIYIYTWYNKSGNKVMYECVIYYYVFNYKDLPTITF